jgi:hypothetical protein
MFLGSRGGCRMEPGEPTERKKINRAEERRERKSEITPALLNAYV